MEKSLGNKHPKILAVCGTFGMGGIEKMLLMLLRAGMKFDVCAVIPDKGVNEAEMNDLGAKTYHLTRRSRNFLRHHQELYRILKDGKYDVLWLNSQNAFFMVLHILVGRMAGVKTIAAHSHNTKDWRDSGKNRMSIIFRRLLYHAADIRIACGKDAAVWLFGREKGVNILPLPIDVAGLSKCGEKRDAERKKLGANEKCRVILQVGRLAPVKNQMFMLGVFREVLRYAPNSMLLFAGDGDMKGKLEEYAEFTGIMDRVRFLGNRKDMIPVYAAADVVVLPSFYEGFPTVLLEAQAAGLPCIASDRIDRSANLGAVRFAPLCIKDFACAVLGARALEKKRKEEVLSCIEDHYSPDKVAETLMALFEEGSGDAKG